MKSEDRFMIAHGYGSGAQFAWVSSLLRSSVTRCTPDVAKHHQTIIAKGAHDERRYVIKMVHLASPCAHFL